MGIPNQGISRPMGILRHLNPSRPIFVNGSHHGRIHGVLLQRQHRTNQGSPIHVDEHGMAGDARGHFGNRTKQRIPAKQNTDGPQRLVAILIKNRNGHVQHMGSK